MDQSNNNNNNGDKPPQKEKQPPKPKENKPKENSRQPRENNRQPRENNRQPKENGSDVKDNNNKPVKENNNRPPRQHNKDNQQNKGDNKQSKEVGNDQQKQQNKGGHGHGHNHHHGHGHNHNNNKKQTTITTTTTTTSTKQNKIKTLEYQNDKSLITLLNLKRFEKEPVNEQMCIICCDPIIFYSIGSCDHNEVCSFCVLRQRVLYGDKKCCICKTENEKVVFTQDKDRKFEQYMQDKTLVFNSKLNVYFTRSDLESSLLRLWNAICQICNEDLGSQKKLEHHLTSEHALMYCKICLDDRKVFLAEQNLYEPKKLPMHMAEWDGGTGISTGKKKGHPICKFCNKYFYGNDQLYDHLNKNHFQCFVCEKKGLLYQYFPDYARIRHHFQDEHYPCMHPECLEKKFIVFPDEITLRSHEISTHLDMSRMSKGQRRNATQVTVNFERTPQTSFNQNSNFYSSNQSIPSADSFSTNLSGQQVSLPRQQQQQQQQQQQSPSTTPLQTNTIARAPAPSTFNPDFMSKDNEKEISQAEIDERNKKLITKIKEILNNEKKYSTFKSLSVDFKNSKIEPNTYYTKFLGLFGTKANDIFDELIALLPDKSKREALSQIHSFMKVVEGEYPSLGGAISAKAPKSNKSNQTSNIWSTGSSSNLSLVKNSPSNDNILSYPSYVPSNRTTTTTTTTTTTSSRNTNSKNNNNHNSASSMASRLQSIPSRYLDDSESSDEDSYPTLSSNLGGDRYSSTDNFSKVQSGTSNKSFASTIKSSSSSSSSSSNNSSNTSSYSFPSLSSTNSFPSLKSNKVPSKDDFPSLPGSENFVPKPKPKEPEVKKDEEKFIKKGGKQKQVLLKWG